MNIKELDKLISELIRDKDDQKLINFYIQKRKVLVKKIWDNIQKNFK